MLTRPFLLAFVACWFGVNARVQGQAPSSQQPATQQPATQQPSSPQPDAGSTSVIPNVAHGPNQQQLFAVLRQVATLLGKKDFSTASRHFVLPPNFKPDMLDGMLERREISQTGIDVLERLGRYGTATEVAGAERAQQLTERQQVDVHRCFGVFLTQQDVTAEVLALWTTEGFKLVRLDDVGKLESAPMPEASAEPTQQDIALLLPELAAAVANSPRDVTAKAKYAMALHQVGNFPAAWETLLAAYKLQPDQAGIARGMTVLWKEFEKLGIFTVGVPMETVEGVLGAPTQRVSSEAGTRWAYGFLVVEFQNGKLHETIDFRNISDEVFSPKEYVRVDLDGRGWRCGTRRTSAQNSMAFYFLPGESLASWSEYVEVERIIAGRQAGTMQDIAGAMDQQIRAVSTGASTDILEASEDSIIIAVHIPAAQAEEQRHQLVRFMRGEVDIHRLSYTLKGTAPSAETQAQWLAIFQAASLEAHTQ